MKAYHGIAGVATADFKLIKILSVDSALMISR